MGDGIEFDEPRRTGRKPQDRGRKLTRSETVTVRLDPKIRYLAELAARKQRRTLSSYIEWALEDSMARVELHPGSGYNNDTGTTVADEAAHLWDIDEADRFARLALRYPDLLTYEEQATWKLIRENGYLWKGHHDKVTREWTWRTDENALILERLREHWHTFKGVANGQADKSLLPAWAKQKPGPPELDDDIPF